MAGEQTVSVCVHMAPFAMTVSVEKIAAWEVQQIILQVKLWLYGVGYILLPGANDVDYCNKVIAECLRLITV